MALVGLRFIRSSLTCPLSLIDIKALTKVPNRSRQRVPTLPVDLAIPEERKAELARSYRNRIVPVRGLTEVNRNVSGRATWLQQLQLQQLQQQQQQLLQQLVMVKQ